MMARRNLIVLGGGEDQLPAYVEGRRLGYRIIGVDQRADALCAGLADEFVRISIREPDAIANRLGPIDVAAVVSPASDTAQPAVAALSRHYATPVQPSDLAVRASVDKAYFRRVVARLGLPSYRHVEGDRQEQLVAAAAEMASPVVVKPVDSSGSKGTRLVSRTGDLPAAVADALAYSYLRRAVIEEAVTGKHCSAECFLVDGRIRFMAVTERTLTDAPYLISTTHLAPADLDAATQARLVAMINEVCELLGYRAGPVNVDFVVDAGGEIFLVEMGARLGGNGLPLLIEHVLGVNIVEAAIRLSAGQPVDVTPTRRGCALLHILHSQVDGYLVAASDPASVRAMPEVLAARLFVEVGGAVRAYTQAAHKIGYVVVVAPTREHLEHAQARAVAAFDLEIKPYPSSRRLTA
jgi:biotin carboxylase